MTKRTRTTEQAYLDGRKAADARLPGNAPYEPNDAALGWAWIGGWEQRMGEFDSLSAQGRDARDGRDDPAPSVRQREEHAT
jgi:hypothetical protein